MTLPTSTGLFIGRDDELAQIRARLADPACRLLTLIGPGGVGKTRLSLEAARQQDYPDGVHFVPLQPLTDPEYMVSTIADFVGIQFSPGDDPRQQLLDYFRDRSLLLVLDNLEQLLDGVTLFSEILAAAPGVFIVATSRERLNLREEWVLEVEGLSYPVNGDEPDPARHSAVALFEQRARQAKLNFELSDAQRPAVGRICRILGGMPLGIELAAAWVRALSCEAIADEIARSLDILETSARNVEPRHRTIRAVFEPTWQRLTDAERDAFMRLSVFRGGFTREAAEQVAGASLRTLTALVDKSLVRVSANGRYDFHELLRQYAEERLSEQPFVREQTQDRHLFFYADFMGHWADDLIGMMRRQSMERIVKETENVRGAFRRAIALRRLNELQNFLGTLILFYEFYERTQEGEEMFRLAVEALRAGFDDADVLQRRLLGLALTGHSLYLGMYSRFEEATACAQESLALLLPLGSTREIVHTFNTLGCLVEGDLLAAQQYAVQGLKHAEGVNSPWGIAFSWQNISWYAFRAGDYEESLHAAQEALALSHKYSFPFGEVWALQRLSGNALIRHNYAEAKRYALEGLAIARAINLRSGMLFHYFELRNIAFAQGAYAEAKRYAQASAQLARESGDRRKIVWTHIALAETMARLGETDASREPLLEVLRIVQNVGDEHLILSAVGGVTLLMAATGKQERAVELLVPVVSHIDNMGGNGVIYRALCDQLEAALAPEDYAAAWKRGTKLELGTPLVGDLLLELSQPLAADQTALAPIPEAASANPLTDRELEVLHLVADGLTNGEIADQLVLAHSTIKWYVNQIFSKLDARSRTQAVARARSLGLIA